MSRTIRDVALAAAVVVLVLVLVVLPPALLGVLADGVRIVCMVSAWAFVVRYWRAAGWPQTEEGQHLLGFTLILALFLTLVVYTRFFGRFSGIEIVGTVLFVLLAALLLQRNVLLTRAQREYATATDDATEEATP